MATGNMLLGTARKKLGDMVFYRQGGQQRSRVRVIPANPRSDKQSVQRMILATAAKMAAAYKPIINHSFEGIAVGAKSVQLFRTRAMSTLRAAASQLFDGTENYLVADFAVKGAPVVGAVENLLIASGSLSFPKTIVSETGTLQLSVPEGFAEALTTANYATELAKIGVDPGDQITVVTQFIGDNPVASVDGKVVNYAQAVRYGRITFKPSLPDNVTGGLFAANGLLNEAVVDKYEGSIGIMYAQGYVTFMIASPRDYSTIQCSTVIRSKKNTDGKFSYSPARMQITRTNFDWNNAEEVYPSYSGDGVEMAVGDNLYLRNAVAAKS